MDIRTYVRPKNIKTAQKILRKRRGAWGDFVNSALEALPEAGTKLNDLQLDKPLADTERADAPPEAQRKDN